MRVLILTPDIYTHGGIARYAASLAAAFGDLISPDNVHVQPLLGDAGIGETTGKFHVFNPVARHLTVASKLRFAGRALAMGSRKYNLVVCTHIGLSPVASLMRLLFGTPFWVSCHGSESWLRFPVDVRWAISRADLLLPVSLFTAKLVSSVNGIPQSKMQLLYNAIPDEFTEMLTSSNGIEVSAAAPNGKEKHILSVGMVTREFVYKGYDTVIRALPRVLQRIPKTRYLIVGEGDDIKRLKGLACESGVQNHVEFKGGISDVDLAACYRACDVFVLPSRARAGQCGQGEGFGRVYAEAALAGKPVVASREGGAAEAIVHSKTGLLIDPASVNDVADALITILTDPCLAAKMGSEGRHWAQENFTAHVLRKRLSDILGNSHRPSVCTAHRSIN